MRFCASEVMRPLTCALKSYTHSQAYAFKFKIAPHKQKFIVKN